ncbi:MAG: hypothetical protein WD294_01880 [Phycisphaeraceae bacterium]
MMRRTIGITAVAAALLLAIFSPTAEAQHTRAPQPDIVPSSWELDFKYSKPRVIAVRIPGEDVTHHYWYMTYEVVNRTGEDQYFVPEFTIVTDAGDVLDANQGIAPYVVKTIQNREANPLLQSPTEVIGRLLQGADNARDGMAIWRMPEHNVRNLRLFTAGLSGEVHIVEDPSTGEELSLRKTLMVEYDLPGSGENMRRKEFLERDSEWVVR